MRIIPDVISSFFRKAVSNTCLVTLLIIAWPAEKVVCDLWHRPHTQLSMGVSEREFSTCSGCRLALHTCQHVDMLSLTSNTSYHAAPITPPPAPWGCSLFVDPKTTLSKTAKAWTVRGASVPGGYKFEARSGLGLEPPFPCIHATRVSGCGE